MLYKTLPLAVAGVTFLSSAAHAQLIIDRAGARDVLWGTDGDFLKSEGKFRANVDSKEKSLSFGYFEQHAATNCLPGGWVFGLRGKVTATDGLKDFVEFKRLPGLELAGLVNWTQSMPGKPGQDTPEKHFIPFVNLRFAYKHEDYVMFDPAQPVAQQISKPSFDGGSAFLSGGVLMNGRFGLTLSGGFERSSNYKKLTSVEVSEATTVIPLPGGGQRIVTSGSQKARMGTLATFNQMPLDFTFTADLGISDAIAHSIPLVPKKYSYGMVFAPYGRLVSKDKGKPEHAIGIGLTLRTLTKPTATDPLAAVQQEKIAFPFSVYVEQENAFSGSRATTVAGAAVVFAF